MEEVETPDVRWLLTLRKSASVSLHFVMPQYSRRSSGGILSGAGKALQRRKTNRVEHACEGAKDGYQRLLEPARSISWKRSTNLDSQLTGDKGGWLGARKG
jgi:hypothetical protein